MVPSSLSVFVTAAGAAAILHALIPDHWLPFVLMGRTRRWGLGRTLALACAGGVIHVCLAVGLGLAVIVFGRGGAEAVARRAGETLEFLSSVALALFGFLYGALSWRRERRHHHASPRTPATGEASAPEGHHHGHLLERWLKADLSALSLVVVIGVSPCALALPILVASAASLGVGGVLVVAMSFGAVTLLTTVGITLFAVLGTRKLDFPILSRYGDLASGVLIGLVGTVLALSELFHG